MDCRAREKLAELLRNGEKDMADDARKLRAILADSCGGATREVAALAAAVEERVPATILRTSQRVPMPGSLDRMTLTLVHNRALDPGAAAWAVRSWSWVLTGAPEPDDSAPDRMPVTGDTPSMRAYPRERLRELVAEYGPDLTADPRRFRGLLNDVAPEYRHERAALVAAVEDGTAQRISRSSTGIPMDGVLIQFADDLAHRTAITSEAAHWAVRAWAWAYGMSAAPVDDRPEVDREPQTEAAGPVGVASGGRPDEPTEQRSVDTGAYRPIPEHVLADEVATTPRRPRRGLYAAVAGIIAALIAVAAVVAYNESQDSYDYGSGSYGAPAPAYAPPTTATSTRPAGTSYIAHIQSTFHAPDGNCTAIRPEASGALAALRCKLTVDRLGNTLGGTVEVIYTRWGTVAQLNSYLNQDASNQDYAESGWYNDSAPTVTLGRYIEFRYENGYPGIDWSYPDKLLTGQAWTSGSAALLRSWWESATVVS